MTQQKDFDAVALNWDEEPRRVELAGNISGAILKSLPLSREWDALDFGCGTGLVTLQLAPALRSITGVDSSSGMIDRLDQKIRQSGYSNVRAELRDLGKGELPPGKYHLITSAMVLHHVENLAPLFQSFKELLQPGGRVALADLESEDGSFHEDPTGVFHHGFSADELSTMLTAAGFTSVVVTRATTVVKGGREYPVFLCTARLS